MLFGQFAYVAALKTTDAELKGLAHVDHMVFDQTLPLIELTKSRVSSRNPFGTVWKRIEQLRPILGNRAFVLDVTSHEDLQNIEIDQLIEEEEGYRNWTNFLSELNFPGLIPVAQLVLGGDPNNISAQMQRLRRQFGRIAIRVDTGLSAEQIRHLLEPAFAVWPAAGASLCVVLDAGFVPVRAHEAAFQEMRPILNTILHELGVDDVVILSSSFPKSPATSRYGGEEEGHFELAEVMLSEECINEFGDRVYHGDYGLVHPVRYQTGGGWVPRIDVPLEREFFYWRYRREDGGYVKAARKVLEDEHYSEIGTWGDEQIAIAAEGNPEGRSPQHWIAVRINLHMTRQHGRITDLRLNQ